MPSRRVHYPDASPARNRLSAANLQQIPEARYHLGVDRWTDLPDGLNYPDRHGESRADMRVGRQDMMGERDGMVGVRRVHMGAVRIV
jgi:hypothetical protein